ncbi:maleylpyruvate isomerase family protein [Nocardioides sp. HDW12B]|uniref:maleylpyruvate isomerase N-terminal domain-containing protein n=1 Tax=Nocardioides sp. HDW12B TaxID=2714939 RepID=UPI00140B8C23|nr:maleylpyruvate isomerase N-terminal domain-containing protein [Nocardioides sp. HDW12B]QIK66461.1 maleylpyruvate isomerase family protein [Nocardioides sp. HDW12B]
MGLSVSQDSGRRGCVDSIRGLLAAVESFDEMDLLGPSRCPGWTRLDVVVHVVAGWHEMLGGLVSVVDAAPTVDAASYWNAFQDAAADEDPVLVLMAQRRRTAAYARPSSATAHLHDVAEAVLRGVDVLSGKPLLWQGLVFEPGDFLTAWAVEHVVHQLDLMSDVAAPASALDLARATVESLAGEPLPADWTVEDAVLIGTGRLPVPEGSDTDAARYPVLG